MLKKIWRWIIGASSKSKTILSFGKDIANNVKIITNSPLLDIIVTLTPTDIDDIALASFRAFMADIIQKLNWSDKLLADADLTEKTIILHTLSATASLWKSENLNNKLSLQTTLSAAQLVYDVSKVDLAAS